MLCGDAYLLSPAPIPSGHHHQPPDDVVSVTHAPGLVESISSPCLRGSDGTIAHPRRFPNGAVDVIPADEPTEMADQQQVARMDTETPPLLPTGGDVATSREGHSGAGAAQPASKTESCDSRRAGKPIRGLCREGEHGKTSDPGPCKVHLKSGVTAGDVTDCKGDAQDSKAKPAHLLYGLDDLPPALLLILLSLQHCLVQLLPCLLAVQAVAPALCLPSDDPARADLLCRLLLGAAVATILNNSSLGLGLGLIQGPCIASVGAVLLSATSVEGDALSGEGPSRGPHEVPEGLCPSGADQFAMGPENLEAVWRPRAQRLQATVLIVAATSLALAAAGLPRLIARFQSPLTAAVTTTLSIFPIVVYSIKAASANWIGALSGSLAVLACGLALRRVCLPVVVCSVRRGHMHARLLPAMSMLAVLATLLVGWTTCAVLTALGLVHNDSPLSTSEWRPDRIYAGSVFAIPWPVPWGWPSLVGMPWVTVMSAASAALAVNVTVQLTSFCAVGAAVGAAPDGERMQRGSLVTSCVGFLGALWGAPCAIGGGQETTGVVALTQAGPMAAARLAGVLLLVTSLFPGLAAALAGIPLPLQAGAALMVLAAGAGQGLRYLREVDLKSARNCIIFGLSILAGLSVACRLGLPALTSDGRLEGVDAMAAAVVAASPLSGAALSMLLDTVLPTSSSARCCTRSPNPA